MTEDAAGLRTAEAEYTGPPRSWFLGDEWYVRDLEAVFRPRWLLAGHVDELRRLRSYLTVSLGAEEVVIRRDDSGVLHAFHNVCPHRGARLHADRTGVASSAKIVCPYHTWSFSARDGSLVNAPEMHADFDRSRYGLSSVHVDTWQGLVFVCLSEKAPVPLDEHMRSVSFAPYEFSRLRLATTTSHEIAANWKIVVENNNECYHCAVNHPELAAVYDWQDLAADDFDDICAARAGGTEVHSHPVHSSHTIGERRVCAVPTPRLAEDVPAHPLASMYVSLEPGVLINVARDSAWAFVPIPLGAHRTELRQYWFVAADAEEGADYRLDVLTEFWNRTMQQDRVLCETVHRGMQNPAYRPGPLNRVHQAGQAGFYHWYTEQIRARFPELVDRPGRQ